MKSAIARLSILALTVYAAAAMNQPWRPLPAAELQRMKYARDIMPNRKMSHDRKSNEPDPVLSVDGDHSYEFMEQNIQREMGELAVSHHC